MNVTTSVLAGRIISDQGPIVDVTVTLKRGGSVIATCQTSGEGAYRFDIPYSGNYQVVPPEGYAPSPASFTVTVPGADFTNAN